MTQADSRTTRLRYVRLVAKCSITDWHWFASAAELSVDAVPAQ